MAFNTIKTGMSMVRDVSAAFTPLQSVLAGLLFFMERHEVRYMISFSFTALIQKEDLEGQQRRH